MLFPVWIGETAYVEQKIRIMDSDRHDLKEKNESWIKGGINKPLSARLMPVPSKKVGEMTEYRFRYFVNSRIMRI